MKNIIFYPFLILLLFASSCSDSFLEEESLTKITSSEVYTNQEGLQLAVVGLYSVQRIIYHEEDAAIAMVRGTDLTVSRCCHDLGSAYYDSGMNPNNSTVALIWRLNYRIIERANAIISGAENVEMIENARNTIIAEAKAFRGSAYFTLLRYFDNIPIISGTTTEIIRDFNVAEPSDVWKIITEDLDFAIDNLSYNSDAGRYNKGAAQHLRAKVALWMEDWDIAADLATSLITDGPYALLDNPKDVFEGISLNHKETIFAIQFARGTVGGGSYHRFAQYFTPQYDQVKGMKIDLEQGGRNWARTFPNDYLISLYESKDKRLDGYYYRNWKYNDENNLPAGVSLGDVVPRSAAADPFRMLSPASTKYWDKERDIGSAESYKDIITMRLAETYLIAAEALMRLNLPDDALDYLNVVRERAGVDDLQVINEDIILDERARELAFEGHRWFTLKRMGKLIERVRLHGGNDDFPQPRENIKEYHVRRPIPQDEIDLMNNYPQNEGYH